MGIREGAGRGDFGEEEWRKTGGREGGKGGILRFGFVVTPCNEREKMHVSRIIRVCKARLELWGRGPHLCRQGRVWIFSCL